MNTPLTAHIVLIGDELLLGRVRDTNGAYIAAALDAGGVRLTGITMVPDDPTAIAGTVQRLDTGNNLVITTGGLGPTKDDITRTAMTGLYGGALVRDPAVTANIRSVFERRGLQLNALTLDQALVPDTCTVIQNTLGTAPVMAYDRPGGITVNLPGVPLECEGMIHTVLDTLLPRLGHTRAVDHHTFVLTGITESALAQHLDDFEKSLPAGVTLAYLPDSPIIKLRLDSASAPAAPYARRLRPLIEQYILAEGEKTLAAIVLEALQSRGLTMATAESCTGGNIAHTLTAVPGSSATFMGGAVTYSNASKHAVLGVDPAVIQTMGAVSNEVVLQMARGAARLYNTHCSVATSGIAGPGGGTPQKPVGTVWIAVHTPSGTHAALHRFPGNRGRVIQRATATALIMLLKDLQENHTPANPQATAQ